MTPTSPLLDRINKALCWAHQSGMPVPSLDMAAIEAEACKREKAERVPGSGWREPLSILLSDLEQHAALSPIGRVIACGQMVGQLRARIRAERLLRAHPEIGQQRITAPVIIVGPMRSGTTRIQRLLACDPRFAYTRMFESMEPVPYGSGAWDRRLPTAAAVHAFMRRADPTLQRIHPTGPLQPDEEFGLHSFSFHGAQYEVQWNVPNFAAYAEKANTLPAYREFSTLLKIMAWGRKDPPGKIQLLKSPQFSADLPSLLRVFPDARLICLARSPKEVVGSAASLVWHHQRLHSAEVDPLRIGREWLRKSADRAQRTAGALAANPAVPRMRVPFEEVNAGWQGPVRRIYDFLGLTLPADVLQRMRAYLQRSRDHRGHKYRLSEFGITAEEVDRAFQTSGASVQQPVSGPSARPSRVQLIASTV